ncbi:MAG: hypothetical protein D6790_01590, partial [Caldilineae bacterium]
EPTAVDMAGMSAQTDGEQVTVQWSTASEADMAGFQVLRGEAENGPFAPVSELIAAQYPGAAQGAAYTYTDREVEKGRTYWYKLQVLKLDGSREPYGLVSVTVGPRQSVFLPMVKQ